MALEIMGNRFVSRNLPTRWGVLLVLGLMSSGCSAADEPQVTESAEQPVMELAQAANPHAKNPHASNPHASNPHAMSSTGSDSQLSSRFVEGKHYKKLSGVPKYEAAEKVQVAEFFSYGCPHCYNMERILKSWHDTKPSSISFERVPAYWNPSFKLLAQAFYTMQVLNVEDKVHDRIFEAIHVRRQKLNAMGDIRQVFVDAGVPAEDFNKTFESFAVQQKLNMASQLFKTYQLKSVPVFVVGGQYVTDVSMAGSREGVTDVIEYLARKVKLSQK
jgi:thiol:disulfide interchange protein DsbA